MPWPFARSRAIDVDRSHWIDDDAWSALVASQRFLDRLDADARRRLRALCGTFVAGKAINGAAGLIVDDAMVGRIVVQACLPILELGVAAYPSFEEIVVYPDDFVVDREIVDEDGVVHSWREAIAGEAWEDGPVVLAWDAAERGAKVARPTPFVFNVVIHEFAHKLDMRNGAVDGMPAFSRQLHPGLDPERWQQVLTTSLDDFAQRVDEAEASIPRHVDPESARADRFYAVLPVDAYAATDEGEFFSVTSEAFFVAPERLAAVYPAWYEMLAAYYRQDPMAAARGART